MNDTDLIRYVAKYCKTDADCYRVTDQMYREGALSGPEIGRFFGLIGSRPMFWAAMLKQQG